MKKLILASMLALAVAACDTAEERAAKHYASAIEYVDAGDTGRALIELRNALENDPTLRDARLLFANLLRDQGRRADAIGQYRYITEVNPQDYDANRAIALIAFDSATPEDARPFAEAAIAARGDDNEIASVLVALDFQKAKTERDTATASAAVRDARILLDKDATLFRARRVLISELVDTGDLNAALVLIDEGLVHLPEDRTFNLMRLAVLSQQQDMPGLEQQLLKMVSLFPEDLEAQAALIQFYLQADRVDDAEALLRDRIDPASDNPEPRITLMRFLSEVRSVGVIRDELQQLLAQDPLPADIAANLLNFKAMLAGAEFTVGDRDAAMSSLEALVDGVEPTAEVDTVKVQLARMREAVGNSVGARALVEQVLEHDATHVEAQKMKADWLIRDGDASAAIALLRQVLADAPTDPQAMSLLAGAYERDGRAELMADMLARAVEASNYAKPESITYGNYLMRKNELASAEDVVLNALRRAGADYDLTLLLAQVHMQMQDWGRVQQDIDYLRRTFTDARAQATVNELYAQFLASQGKTEDLAGFLEELSAAAPDAVGPRLAVVRNYLRSGDLDQAQALGAQLAADFPDTLEVQLLSAQLKDIGGDPAGAIADLKAIVAATPTAEPAWNALYILQLRDGSPEAQATLDAALAALPDNRNFPMALATRLERNGDFDGAIAIYEGMYAKNGDDAVAANNLAAMLSAHRTDEESIRRAWDVARRLSGFDVAAFKDTYGWAAFLAGEMTLAVPALEAARAGLPQDPSVAFHLGQAYAKLGQVIQAKEQFEAAIGMIDGGNADYPYLRPQVEQAIAALPQ